MPDTKEAFTSFSTYPVSPMVPTINMGPDNREIVTMLLTADNEIIDHIKNDGKHNLDIQISTYLLDNDNGKKDLVMRFDLFYPNGHATYEAFIYGEIEDQQENFIKVLQNSNTITVLLANQNGKIGKVIPVDWEYRKFENSLNQLLM